MEFNKTLVVLVGSIIGCQLLVAQPTPPSAPPQPPSAPKVPGPGQSEFQQRLGTQIVRVEQPQPPPTFDLDFPGGTPAQLIAAIEKASGNPVNAVIPTDLADTQLPPLKMKRVTVPQLFEALMLSTMKQERYLAQRSYSSGGEPREMYNTKETSYGFRTQSPGPDAVWYFYYHRLEQPPLPPSVFRFYNLDLAGKTYTIQDITTAIKTGWDLLGIKDQPTLKYHPETKLLIAVGQHEHLQLIDSVLRELGMRTEPQTRSPFAPKKDGDSPAK